MSRKTQGLRFTASVICVICTVTALISFFGIIYLEEHGYYDLDQSGIENKLMSRVADSYAVRILQQASVSNISSDVLAANLEREGLFDDNMEFTVFKDDSFNINEVNTRNFRVRSNYLYKTGGFVRYAGSYLVGHEGFDYSASTRSFFAIMLTDYHIVDTTYYVDNNKPVPPPGDYVYIFYDVADPLKDVSDGNLFYKAHKYSYYFMYLRDNAAWVMVLSVCLAFLMLLYLIKSSDAAIRWYHKIPLEILTAIGVLMAVFQISFVLDISRGRTYYGGLDFVTSAVILIFLIAVVTLLILGMIINIAVRCKAHILINYSLVNYLYRGIRKAWHLLAENVPVTIRVIFLMLAITLIQVAGLAAGSFNRYAGIAIFICYKLIAFMAVLWLVLQFLRIKKGSERVVSGEVNEPISTTNMISDMRSVAENINHAGEGIAAAVTERTKSERMKTELITNVSHDIKTPLTSIINYVDLLRKEDIDNPKAKEYMDVIDRQSSRLKKLIEDLIEASKASTGNVEMELERVDVSVLLSQVNGEYKDKLESKGLNLIEDLPEEHVYVKADGRYLWRVIDNLMNNISKYAMPGTRVYTDLKTHDGQVEISFKNISKSQLNISPDELTERFVRGDASRNTEGSGLGLSIAYSLTELMGGKLDVSVDGDLFKAVITTDQA